MVFFKTCMPALLDDALRLISDVWPVLGAGSEMHIGDLCWALFHRADADIGAATLWYDDSEVVQGIAVFPGQTWCDMVVRPAHAASALSEAMIAWATDECRRKNPADTPLVLRVGRRAVATERLTLLDRLSFHPMRFGFLALALAAQQQTPQRALPDGFVCRPLASDDLPSRVAAFRSAFPSDAFSVADYTHLMSSPNYDPPLDLVVVDRFGTVAAFCTLWLDERNRVGLLEPVGCHANFRRQGLAHYAMLEGLQRLWERGATEAVIRVHSENTAALALYTACGFAVASSEFGYEKQLG